jgi:hypothetical protein
MDIPTHFRDDAHFRATKRAIRARLDVIQPDGRTLDGHAEEAARLSRWMADNAEWAEIHTMTDNLGTVRLRYAIRAF